MNDKSMGKRTHILLTHRYFAPSPQPYGWMLHQIAQHLSANDIQVSIYSGAEAKITAETATLDEQLRQSGIVVHRRAMRWESRGNPISRIANATSYVFGLVATILHVRPDIVTAATFPPVVPAFFAALTSRLVGAKFVYHVQDIHPEITAPKIRGLLRPFYSIILGALDRMTLTLADHIITLSFDMTQVLKSKGARDGKIKIINNLALVGTDNQPDIKADHAATRKLQAIFAGNLGAYQDITSLALLTRQLVGTGRVSVKFAGDGACRNHLRSMLTDLNDVEFLDAMPFAELVPHLHDADLGLVSLDDTSWRYAYPSKIATYLRFGLPIVCLVSSQSELARTMEERGFGIALEPEAVNSAVEQIDALAADRQKLALFSSRAEIEYARSHANGKILHQWLILLDDIDSRATI